MMQARDLVELAALASLHGPLVIDSPAPLPSASVEQYWLASKCRFDRWGRALKRIAATPEPPAHNAEERSGRVAVLEEVLTGEVLTRVWAAVLVGHDHKGKQDTGTVGRSVLIGQQEARNRVLSLLVNGPGVGSALARSLNRLRRRAECWSDVLVGYLSVAEDLCEHAANPQRARRFAADVRREGTRGWPLLFASLRASFSAASGRTSPNADLNADIAAAVVGCFEPEVFDSTGLLRSLWMSRLSRATSETQGLIEALFAADQGQPAERSSPAARAAFFQRRFPH